MADVELFNQYFGLEGISVVRWDPPNYQNELPAHLTLHSSLKGMVDLCQLYCDISGRCEKHVMTHFVHTQVGFHIFWSESNSLKE